MAQRVSQLRSLNDIVEKWITSPDHIEGYGRGLAGAVLELPRRIGEDGAETLAARGGEQVDVRGEGGGRGEHTL